MIIPIVRRTLTVTVRRSFRFPFQCDTCRLSTWATSFAQGVGSASMAYMRPDENVARHRAMQSAHATAQRSFAQSPCPRCGAHSAASRGALGAWQQRVVSRKKVRFGILIGGLAASLVFAGGCGTLVVATSDGSTGDAIGAGVVLAFMWVFAGLAATGIAWAIAGPGKQPQLLSYIPPNVQFDPPDASQVQGTYRTG